jgi:hypothetical protein
VVAAGRDHVVWVDHLFEALMQSSVQTAAKANLSLARQRGAPTRLLSIPGPPLALDQSRGTT